MGHANPLAHLIPERFRPHPTTLAAPEWRLAALAGRLCEICGHGATAAVTLAMRLVVEAQTLGEPVAWISHRSSQFYPPDAAANGVDLDALAVIRLAEISQIGKAADQLARSGAFGLLILDLGPDGTLAGPHVARLLGLAQTHGIALLCLTGKAAHQPSVSPLVSLRGDAVRSRREPGLFACDWQTFKDKRRAPGWRHQEVYLGPPGLR